MKRIPTGMPGADRALDGARGDIDFLLGVPIISGQLYEEVDLPDATTRVIRHNLGRRVRGWQIIDLVGPTSTGRIERVRDSRYDLTKVLPLKATGWGATITVAVWVC